MSEPKYQIGKIVTRKELIEIFAKEMCHLQKKANYWYYERNNQDLSDYILNLAGELKDLSSKMGICEEMYERSYEIYDYRRSGADDITQEEINYLLSWEEKK